MLPLSFCLCPSFFHLTCSPTHLLKHLASPFPRPQLLLSLCYCCLLRVCCPFLPNPSACLQPGPPSSICLSLYRCVINKTENKKQKPNIYSLTLLLITKVEKMTQATKDTHGGIHSPCPARSFERAATNTHTYIPYTYTQTLSLTHIKTLLSPQARKKGRWSTANRLFFPAFSLLPLVEHAFLWAFSVYLSICGSFLVFVWERRAKRFYKKDSY